MAPTSTFDLYDRILGGTLRQLLTDWRTEGLSLEDISYKLRDLDVQAKAATVGRWIKEKGITAETRNDPAETKAS